MSSLPSDYLASGPWATTTKGPDRYLLDNCLVIPGLRSVVLAIVLCRLLQASPRASSLEWSETFKFMACVRHRARDRLNMSATVQKFAVL